MYRLAELAVGALALQTLFPGVAAVAHWHGGGS